MISIIYIFRFQNLEQFYQTINLIFSSFIQHGHSMRERYFFRRYFGLRAIPMLIIVPGKKLTWPALVVCESVNKPEYFFWRFCHNFSVRLLKSNVRKYSGIFTESSPALRILILGCIALQQAKQAERSGRARRVQKKKKINYNSRES